MGTSKKLRLAEVASAAGCSVGTIRNMLIGGRFPQPIRLSARNIFWMSDTIDAWLKEREECAAQK